MTNSEALSTLQKARVLKSPPSDELAGQRTVAILLPDLRIGGAERVALNLGHFLLDEGYEVTFVLRERAGEYLAQLDPRAAIVALSAPRIRNALKPLAEYFRSEKPAATLAFMWPLTVVAVVAKALAHSQTRLVLTEHTTWSRSELVRSVGSRFVARATMNMAFRSADAIVSVSHGAADDLAQFAKIKRSRVRAIYNPIVSDSKFLETAAVPREPQSWWEGPHKRVLAVGTLIPLKGFTCLLRSFAEMRATLNAKLLILGDGPTRQELEGEIRMLKLGGDVFLPGSVEDPTPYYARADLCVMSSEVEGFGNVLVEALACGTPVVSTDCPSGPREILGNGEFGRLVPVGDSRALAGAMLQTLRSPLPPEILRSRAAVFSVASAGKQYLDLLFPQSQRAACESVNEAIHT